MSSCPDSLLRFPYVSMLSSSATFCSFNMPSVSNSLDCVSFRQCPHVPTVSSGFRMFSMLFTNLHCFRTLAPPCKLSWFPSAWESEFFWTCNCLGPTPPAVALPPIELRMLQIFSGNATVLVQPHRTLPPVGLRMLHWLQSLSSSTGRVPQLSFGSFIASICLDRFFTKLPPLAP